MLITDFHKGIIVGFIFGLAAMFLAVSFVLVAGI